ncbi:MAG TPA: HAD-IC family P-type ATPase [Methanomassiliicoccales archaeon]|nr:HAD-IC family P-type ATPase [Methanomassiliicoccales archaeon]
MESKEYCQSPDEVLKELSSSPNGLGPEEARARLSRYGFNELEVKRGISPLALFLSQFKSFIVLVLIVAAFISVAIAILNGTSEEYLDAAVILLIVLINAVLGFFQEYRAEKSLQALKELTSPIARVIRSGAELELPARELVPGDVIILSTGNKVPADGRLIEASNLKLNEAPLTGESLPVAKTVACVSEDADLMDRDNMVFSGCLVEYGRGKAVVTRTGMRTQLGRIAELIEADDTQTPLQMKLARLGKQLSVLVLITCTVVFLVGLLQGVAADRMFLTAVSLAVAAIPEGLPAIVTVSLALGVERMAKRNAIVRRLPAVETLGSATVICTDKTGTLTKGEMNIREIWLGKRIQVTGEGYSPDGKLLLDNEEIDVDSVPGLEMMLRAGALCNDAVLVEEGGAWTIKGDTTEGTLLVLARKAKLELESIADEFPRINELPFDSDKKRMITVHEGSGIRYAFLKGATESTLSISSKRFEGEELVPLDEAFRKLVMAENDGMADRALRVLALGFKQLGSPDEELEKDFIFLGLVGMIDAPRQEAIEAVKRCKKAGIRVMMITGDHERTARAIGLEMGIATERDEPVLSGKDLERMSDQDLIERVRRVNIFARVSPEHKVRIVAALQSIGEVVAMTGDGVNDAPALKKAEIGVAMGVTGTDVSKEASDIVLTDDNFASIVDAVEEGRGIYDNIRKFVTYLLSCNVGEVLTMFTATLVFVEAVLIPFLLPIQILWMNLVTDSFPALALGMEKTSPKVMERGPRDPNEPPVGRKALARIGFLGAMMALGALLVFQFEYSSGLNSGLTSEVAATLARTVAFCSIVSFQLFLAFSARSEDESLLSLGPFTNRKLVLAVVASFIMQLVVVYVPALNGAFGTTPIAAEQWLPVLAVGLLGLISNEAWKFLVPRIKANKAYSIVRT